MDIQKRRRFPFSALPKGWFVVALSADIPPGEVVRMFYFGRELVAYRGASGRAYVMGAYCPHLGAHLGHGGKIEGETIRCPFHGWRFEGEGGRCAEIPYADKIPPKARLETLPVREQDGVVHVFHDPAGGPPWDLPKLDEEGWTEGRVIHWRGLKTHAQEIFENTVDIPHLGPIHGARTGRIVGEPVFEGEKMEIDIEFQAPGDVVGMPGTLNDVHLHVSMRGLGWVAVRTHVRNADVHARQRIYATPVDEDTVDIRGIIHVRKSDDPAFTEQLADLFYRAFVSDFALDFPIWENKRYLTRPLMVKGDGPLGAYRRWCTQFYPPTPSREASTDEPAQVPDVPVSALGAGRARRPAIAPALRQALEPLRQRVTGAADLLLAAARRRVPFGARPPEAPAEPKDVASAPAQATPPTTEVAPVSGLVVRSAEEYFETLERRFVPGAAGGVDAVFQWELGGEGGGVFHALVRDGRLEVQRGAHAQPTVSLVLPAADYVRVVNGELDGTRAFTVGGGKVKGSIAAAMKMRSLFPARGAG